MVADCGFCDGSGKCWLRGTAGCVPIVMDNHVHLLVTPQEAGDVGRLMQRLGRSYVCLFNTRHKPQRNLWRSGTRRA